MHEIEKKTICRTLHKNVESACLYAAVFLAIFGAASNSHAGVTPESPEVQKLVANGLKFLETHGHDQLGGKCLIGLAFLKAGRADHSRVAEALKGGGSRQNALSLLEQCAGDPRRTDRLIVGALAALGDQPAAIVAARRLIASRGYRYADVLFEPNLASARGTPAYRALVSGLGLPVYWRADGRSPDICRGSGPPGFCGIA